MIYTSKEVPYPYYGMKSYRIEINAGDPYRWFQRHIWTREDGTTEVDDWIPTPRMSQEMLEKKGYRPKEADS